MKKITHVLPCGAIYQFRQYGYKDMSNGLVEYMFKSIPRDIIDKKVKGDNYGRKIKPWGQAYYAKMMNTVWKHVVEHLLDSDRVVIPHNKRPTIMYIGQVPDDQTKFAKRHKKLRPYFATSGNRYTILLDGVEHSYYFRMTQRNRARLYTRIKEGKNYH